MAFDGITVACMAHELHKNLSGGRISKIAQPETDELLLTIKSQEGNFRLLLSASASLPLVYLTQTNKPSPLTAPNFCMLQIVSENVLQRKERQLSVMEWETDWGL